MLILNHHVIHVSVFTWLYISSSPSLSFGMHDSYAVYMHAIGVPEGVTLLEFKQGLSEEQQQV